MKYKNKLRNTIKLMLSTGEESVLASKSVPVAIAICLGVCTLLYVC